MRTKMIAASLLATLWTICLVSCQSKANAAAGSDNVTEEVLVADHVATSMEDEDPIGEANGVVTELTPAQYDKLVAHYQENPHRYVGYRPCVVDFYATWCGPCKKLAPIMEKLAEKYKGRVSFYKVDVDKAEALSGVYGIQSIPTVFFCANGEIRGQVGLMPEEALEEVISEMLTAPLK